jgi:dephospho-CoA kinase
MILVGLTGGIGSGKSTVSLLLANKGAVIIDADAIVRELQAKGAPLLASLADHFGSSILMEDGELDRPALAGLVFGNPTALAELNALVHPVVGREMSRRIDAEMATNHVVVLDIPLLAENPREGLAAVLVVDCPIEVAVHRLVTHRGFSEAEALARVARQATREQRLAIATHVVHNDGDRASLLAQVEVVWPKLVALPATTAADLVRHRASGPARSPK